LYRRYRRRKLSSVIAAYQPHEVTHSYGGHLLTVRLADAMAAGWYDRDGPPSTGRDLLRERGTLRPGATVFNFGAHHGVVALVFAREVGPTGRVVAVEAVAHNARAAEVNRDLNGAENLEIIHAAGAASEGTISFSEGLNGCADERGLTQVSTRTVDGLSRTHGVPDLVMIDVEGYEDQVLRGSRAALANAHTSFVVEVHKPSTLARYGASIADVFGHFSDFDVLITPGHPTPLAPFETLPQDRTFLVAVPRS
jgi:FkbM family methyltransferase